MSFECESSEGSVIWSACKINWIVEKRKKKHIDLWKSTLKVCMKEFVSICFSKKALILIKAIIYLFDQKMNVNC